MSKPLTPTQIKVLVDKLYREASAAWNEKLAEFAHKADAEQKAKDAAVRKARRDYIAAGKFNKNDLAHFLLFHVGRESMTKQELANAGKSVLRYKEEPAEKDKPAFEGHVCVTAKMDRWERHCYHNPNHPVERLIDDLKFKITMANAENYASFMIEFRSALSDALSKLK